jgi:hypothetical protein
VTARQVMDTPHGHEAAGAASFAEESKFSDGNLRTRSGRHSYILGIYLGPPLGGITIGLVFTLFPFSAPAAVLVVYR